MSRLPFDPCHLGVTFKYGSRPDSYKDHLILIAASHNQSATWLTNELKNQHGSFHSVLASNQRINFAFPGLLLRLADIMDFDASRTPKILYHHLGLQNDDLNLGIDLSLSQREWRKHLAVAGVEMCCHASRWTLTYSAPSVPHPAIHKSILDFLGCIRDEVRFVGAELQTQLRDPYLPAGRYAVRLPEIREEIKPALDNGRPIYRYRDIQFQLDPSEIIQLLMGEKIYGKPELCIRELLQNALDALEMRELRFKMKAKGQQPAEPVDGEYVANEEGLDKPGQFILDGQVGRLEVQLTWGYDEVAEQYWIKVEDNGIGMTEDAVCRYFTQIGKSFYRSPDYRQEQDAMRQHGLIASSISTFGIGILSCFMIADRVQVRTCPGGHTESNPANTDISISGPGSLFWMQEGTRSKQGTELRIWLKSELHGKPIRLVHSPDKWLEGLRLFFGYQRDKKLNYKLAEAEFDLPFIAGQHVVWPRFPMFILGPNITEACKIDDRFHIDTLAPIDPEVVQERAAAWDITPEHVGAPQWSCLDWTDQELADSTGSRVRLWIPTNGKTDDQQAVAFEDVPGKTRLGMLAGFVEPVTDTDKPRNSILVQGMHVADVDICEKLLTILPHVGARLWIDLRGEATARLTASREKIIFPDDVDAWKSAIAHCCSRFVSAMNELAAGDSRADNLRTVLTSVSNLARREEPSSSWRLGSANEARERSLSSYLFKLDIAVAGVRHRARIQGRNTTDEEEGWSNEDWSHPENLSALWNVSTGEILWTTGACPASEMPNRGKPTSEFFCFDDGPSNV